MAGTDDDDTGDVGEDDDMIDTDGADGDDTDSADRDADRTAARDRDADRAASRQRPAARDDADDNADAADDDTEVETDEEEWKPPSQDRWKRLQVALKKANDQSKRERLENRKLREKVEDGDERTVRLASENALKKYKPVAVEGKLEAALIRAGLRTTDSSGEQLDEDALSARTRRINRVVDFDAIDIEDDGTVTGLGEQVAEIRATFPELFAKPEPAVKDKPAPRPGPRGSARADAAPRKAEPEKPQTSAQRIAAGLTGRS